MNNKERKYFESIFSQKINKKSNVNNLLRKKYNKCLKLTNINYLNGVNDIYKFSYEYQRYDSKLSYDDFENVFYDLKNVHSKTFFTNCGMSSIFSVLFALKNKGNFNIIYGKDIYFETQKLMKKLKLNKGKKIYYFDSISDDFNLNINKKNSILIIDTTCYHSHYYKKFINNMLLNNNIIILVRSHIKLDMLGLEYSYLGSVTYLIPNNINNRKYELIKGIIRESMEICGNIGIFAMENNIFPLLNDPYFIKLNSERTKRINENNEYFYNEIKSNNIILHKHKLFLTLTVDVQDIAKLKEFINKISINSKGLFKFSPSFGFDYIALDTYFDYQSKLNTIRISIGDVAKKDIDKFIFYYKEFIDGKI